MTEHNPLNAHAITIEYRIHGQHSTPMRAQVMARGDGGIEHWLDATRAAMVAAGFPLRTAQQLMIVERADE